MPERHWLVQVGPLDDQDVKRWVHNAGGGTDQAPFVELIDDRVWFACASDVDTVRAEIEALRIAMTSLDRTGETWLIVGGILSGMETWLERDYDAEVDRAAVAAAEGLADDLPEEAGADQDIRDP